jgi:hypothetical protein
MTKSKSNTKSVKDTKKVKTSAKAESKKGSRATKEETSQESEEEQTPATIYAAAIMNIEEMLGNVKDQFKVIKGLAKKLGKRTRKPGTVSANNAFTCQMGIPAPLISLLRHPVDNKKLSKKSTLSRTQLVKAINNYCKKADLGQGGGVYKPDEPLREALLMKKKETFKACILQKIISNIYKHYGITRAPVEEGDDTSSKKSKRQLAEDSESENIRSEDSEKPKSRKRSNA